MADVASLHTWEPRVDQKILIDTNVLIALCYSRRPADRYAKDVQFVKGGLTIGTQFYRCPLQLSEVANVIEKTEYDLYRHFHGNQTENQFSRKMYRECEDYESAVIKRVETAWQLVKQFAPNCADILLCDTEEDAALKRVLAERIDGNDAFLVEAMNAHKIPYILSEDRDFASVNGITVLTANGYSITAATASGRIVYQEAPSSSNR